MRLADFQEMTWEEAESTLTDKTILLAMCREAEVEDITRAYRDNGIEAGMAALCSYLFMEKHGAPATALRGVTIYREMVRRGKSSDLLDNMEYWVYMSASCDEKRKWPIKPLFSKPDQKGGLANVMLFIASREMYHGANTEHLGARSIREFLTKGMERKRNEEPCEDRGRNTSSRTMCHEHHI